MKEDTLYIDHVSCWKGDTCLFKEVTFSLQAGDLTLLEGANGSGKTSLMRIIAGLSRPEAGDVTWKQTSIYRSPLPYHQNLLYIGHKPGLKDVLSAHENLTFYQEALAKGKNAEAIHTALVQVGLEDRQDIPVKQLSAGQQRRVALARLYLTFAQIWLLDEPFTAIDKAGVAKLTALFRSHCQKGGIILYTSHQNVPDSDIKRISLS